MLVKGWFFCVNDNWYPLDEVGRISVRSDGATVEVRIRSTGETIVDDSGDSVVTILSKLSMAMGRRYTARD